MPITSFPFQTEIEVIFRDVDAMGHVNNAVYFTYMETARTKFFAQQLAVAELKKLPFIVAEATCTYKSAAFFGERLQIGMGVSRMGGKSFDLAYQLTAVEDVRLVATAKTVMVAYDYTAEKTISIPADLRVGLEGLVIQLL